MRSSTKGNFSQIFIKIVSQSRELEYREWRTGNGEQEIGNRKFRTIYLCLTPNCTNICSGAGKLMTAIFLIKDLSILSPFKNGA
jgi:hypothetical protein